MLKASFGMRVRIFAALSVIAVIAHPVATAAQTSGYGQGVIWNSQTTGSELTKLCRKDWEPGFFDSCGSYLIGIIDGIAWTRSICPPEGVGTRQLAAIAHKALWDDPTRWNEPAVSIIGWRLFSLYPCPQE